MEKWLIKLLYFYVHLGEGLEGLDINLNNIGYSILSLFYFMAVCLFTCLCLSYTHTFTRTYACAHTRAN